MPEYSIKKYFIIDWLYPTVKHFYLDGRGLFRDESEPIHMSKWVTESFDEDTNDVNHMLWSSHWADLNAASITSFFNSLLRHFKVLNMFFL